MRTGYSLALLRLFQFFSQAFWCFSAIFFGYLRVPILVWFDSVCILAICAYSCLVCSHVASSFGFCLSPRPRSQMHFYGQPRGAPQAKVHWAAAHDEETKLLGSPASFKLCHLAQMSDGRMCAAAKTAPRPPSLQPLRLRRPRLIQPHRSRCHAWPLCPVPEDLC